MKIADLIVQLENEIKVTNTNSLKIAQTKRLAEIMSIYNGEDVITSFEEVAKQLKIDPSETKMNTGWTNLDKVIQGFRLQQLVVVSGITKHGKTSFLMDLTTKLAEYNPLWFCLEESPQELIRKFIERGEKPPHGFTPKSFRHITIDWIEKKIIEAIVKHGTRIVFIDQLDFLVPFTSENHALKVGQCMRDLKNIAKEWNITIVLICHLVKVKMDTNPTLEDLKGSSSIGQEADTVILVWRETKREKGETIITNNTNVSVQANRRMGTTGNIKMVYHNGHYYEEEWKKFGDYEDEATERLIKSF